MLHDFVDGEHQTVTVLRFYLLFILEGHVGADGVLRRNQPPGGTGELLIIICLQAGKALVVSAGKTQQSRRKAAERIISFIVFNQPDAVADFFLFFKFQDFILYFGLHFAL